MTLGSGYKQHLNFCVARSLNKENTYIMGLDLEIRYVLKRLEKLFGVDEMKHFENVILKTLEENFEMTEAHRNNVVQSYLRNPQSFELKLTDDDFISRLQKVPTADLDTHSFHSWRNSNHVKLNETPYPVTQDDIYNGEALAPPTGAHLGLQMLELNGFLPSITQPRRARQYAVTFI
jgi:hypothetical protein